MSQLDDLDLKVRSQVVSGVDVAAAARHLQAAAEQTPNKPAASDAEGYADARAEDGSVDGNPEAFSLGSGEDDDEDVEAAVTRLVNVAYSAKATEVSQNLESREHLEKMVGAGKGPSCDDVSYYALMKLIVASMADTEKLVQLLQKWVATGKLPKFTNIMAWYSIEDIAEFLSAGPLKSATVAEFEAKVDKYLPVDESQPYHGLFAKLIRYIFGFKALKDKPQELGRIGTNFTKDCLVTISGLHFPKAEDTTTAVDTIASLCIYLEKQYGKDVINSYSICQKALFVSYQSIPVMRLWCVTAIYHSSVRGQEVVPSFETYLAYINDAKVKNGNVRVDPVDTIETYLDVLLYVTDTWTPNRKTFLRACGWVTELKNDIDDFIKIVGDKPENYTDNLQRYMSSLWFRLGRVYESLCKVYAVTEDNLDKRLEETYHYYKKAVDLVNPLEGKTAVFSQYYFHFALVLAKRLQFDEAIQNMKRALRLEPDSIEYLNVIVLLYSAVEENMDKSLSIASGILDNLRRGVDKEALSFKQKVDILQLYVTYVALVEASADSYAALDCLSEMFDVAYKLLGNFTVTGPASLNAPRLGGSSVDGTPLSIIRTVSSVRPTIRNPQQTVVSPITSQSKKDKVLSKIRRSHGSVAGTSAAAGARANGYATKKSSSGTSAAASRKTSLDSASEAELKVIHSLWLWTSKLFERCGQLDDSRECVLEADAVYKPTYKSFARMGQVIGHHDPGLALQQLEISLNMNDTDNFEAVVGFAQLLTSECSLFISDQDKWSAFGRCRNYLESLSTQYPTANEPEIYFYLSKIYRANCDQHKEEEALWKVVSLEETRPVRSIFHVVDVSW